ncbi:MAG: hypothetical protein HDR15_07120 [Lachnospiraceae bacterium]|nr:hypothetical protein [Lachnospiraceae bacterium]
MMAIPNEELMAKAREVKSAEELLALAKENDVELTEEQANAYFEQMNTTGELSDDELDSVAGGGCYKGNRLVVSYCHACKWWTCKKCGGGTKPHPTIHDPREMVHDCQKGRYGQTEFHCTSCKQCSYEKGLWLCNDYRNRK